MFDELDDLLQDFTLEETTEKVKTVKLQEGERRIVSILFADIKGFTSLSEKLDPERVRNILDKLLKLFSNCIEEHGGYVDKFEGDLVMALFGAKSANENDTERAIHTGLEMLEKLGQFNSVLKKIPLTKLLNVELGLRIGINTGLVTTGKIGLEREGDFTVYGDAVNLASRMESNAPTNRIMVSEDSKKLVEDWFDFEDEKEIEVKGKSEKVKVFLVKSTKERKLPKWLQHKRSVFVGRDRELELLEKPYQRVLQNLDSKQTGEAKPIVLGLKGVAGLGKSRLAYEFLKLNLKDSPHRNLSVKGFCSNVATSPYSMFTTLIKNYLGITLLDSRELIRKKLEEGFQNLESFLEDEIEKQNLRKSLPIIGFLFGLKFDDVRLELKGRDLQIHIQISIRYFLETASFRANKLGFPFLVVFEDLHWIEESSASALNFLLQTLNLEERRESKPLNQILFILLYRPEYEVHKEIKFESDFQEIELSAFDKKTSMELIKTVLGEIEIPESVKTLLLEKSSGNPFYIEEWIEFVKSKDLILFEDGNLTLKETEIPVPQSLSALILSRLDTLDENLKTLLQKASVIGNQFSVQILSEVEKRFSEESEILGSLQTLENKDFIRHLLSISEFYLFNHIITREVAYNSLLISNRKILHKIIAETIEEKFKDVLDSFYSELANHYDKAEMKEKAIEFLEKAGDQAKVNYENQKAVDFYDRLLRILEGDENFSELRIDVLSRKGWIFKLTGKLKKAEEVFKGALELSEKLGVKDKIAYSLISVGSILNGLNKQKDSLQAYKKSLSIFKEIGDKVGIARVERSVGGAYRILGDYPKCIKYYERSLKLFTELNDKDGIATTMASIGVHYSFLTNDFSKTIKYFKKALKIKEQLGDKSGVAFLFGQIGHLYQIENNYEKSFGFYKKSLEIFKNTGDIYGVAGIYQNIGSLYWTQGKFLESMAFFETAFKIYETLGDKVIASTVYGKMGLVCIEEGNGEKAVRYFQKELQIREPLENKYVISAIIGNLGTAYTKKGDYPEALKCFEKSLKIKEELGYENASATMANMGFLFLEKGEFPKALEFFNKALKLFSKFNDKRGVAEVLGDKAKVHLKVSDYKKALACLKEAITTSKEINNNFLLSRQLIEKAEILLMLKKPKEAQVINSEGLKLSTKISKEPYLFKGKVLSEKINFALGDKTNPPNQLRKMFTETEDKEEIATLNYELWKMDQGEKYKIEALKLYRELYSKTPKFDYKKKIEEMEKLKVGEKRK